MNLPNVFAMKCEMKMMALQTKRQLALHTYPSTSRVICLIFIAFESQGFLLWPHDRGKPF